MAEDKPVESSRGTETAQKLRVSTLNDTSSRVNSQRTGDGSTSSSLTPHQLIDNEIIRPPKTTSCPLATREVSVPLSD